jgi:hypothetical protein
VLEKPDFMGVSRLTINENNGDLTNLGDRTLAVFIGRGYYHFATYDLITNDVNVNQNIDYDTFLDNRWVYIYFGYKEKQPNVGSVVGFILYQDKLVKKTDFPGVLHKRVKDFIHFQVGSANTARNEYANFNGQITQVMFALGKGAAVSDENVLRSLVFEKFNIHIVDEEVEGDVPISEEKTDQLRDDVEVAPHTIEDH